MSFSWALILRKWRLKSKPSPLDNLKSTNREGCISIRLTLTLSLFCRLSVVKIVTCRGEFTEKLYLRWSKTSFNLWSVLSALFLVWKRVIRLTSLWNGFFTCDAPGVDCICVLSNMWSRWTGCEKHNPFTVASSSTSSNVALPIPLSSLWGSGWEADIWSLYLFGRCGEETSASVHLLLNVPVPVGVFPGEHP